jgi:uncharacterized membrane protein
MMFTDGLSVLAILCVLIWVGNQLALTPWGKHLGTALMVIILGAVAANLNIIPTASNAIPLYSGIFHYIAPIAIFYLILNVNLRQIKRAGLPMISLFVLGSIGTVGGVVFAYWLTSPATLLGDSAAPIAGMLTGTYTGGSINFNAVALHYGINEQGNLYAGTVAVDNVFTTLWVIATLALPRILGRFFPDTPNDVSAQSDDLETQQISEKDIIRLKDLVLLIPLGLIAFGVSEWLNNLFPMVPMILIITTIGLILAQIPYIHNLTGGHSMGLYMVYLFLIVIGAYCELDAIGELGEIGLMLSLFFGLTILIHGLIIHVFGRFFIKDWQMLAIASQANVGGGTTAMALAESFKREELIVPAILIGTLGNAMGTYLGFMVASVL